MDRAADLADIVQGMRKLMWRCAFLSREDDEAWLAVAQVDWQRPETLRAAADRLHPARLDLAEEWAFVSAALDARPKAG